MKTLRTLGMLVGMVAMASPALASTRHVNCDVPGQTITKALKTAQPGDTIHVQGTCEETVTITTDRVTLDGGGRAILQGPGGGQPGEVSHGLLNIVGVQGVEIRGFTVQNSAADGINGRQGAAFTVHDVRVLRSANDGVEATETSTVRFLGICEVRGNGEYGLAITRGSSALFSAERVTTAENARAGIFVIGTSTVAFDTGTVYTTQNSRGIVALGHSSLTLGRNMPTILAEHNTFDGILVADTSDLRLDGGMITAARNGRTGLSFGGTGGLGNIAGVILSEYNTEGARAEDDSRIAQLIAGRMTIRNNTTGIIVENGSDIRLTTGATAITDNGTDIVLRFGSRGTFNGNTIGTITCDATSLVRGDEGVTCPNP